MAGVDQYEGPGPGQQSSTLLVALLELSMFSGQDIIY